MNVRRARRSDRRRPSRGQSLAEFALVIPVFLLILSGVLDFGFMLFQRMTVINAARDGARVAVTTPTKANIPALADSTVRSVSTTLDQSPSNLIVTATCVHTATDPGCAGPNDWSHAIAGDSVNVVVTYHYHSFFPLLFGSSFDLTSNVQMVLE